MKSSLLGAILLLAGGAVAVAVPGPPLLSRQKRVIYFPLNIPLPNRPAAAVSTAAPGLAVAPQLTAAENVSLALINSFRAAHRALPVTWSAQLRDQALQCANAHAAAVSLTSPTCAQTGQSESNGANNNPVASQGIRSIITDPTNGWNSENLQGAPVGSAAYWANPANVAATQRYTQMIWAGHRQVGCAYSTTTVPVLSGNGGHVFVCLWTPPGNVASGYPQNVFPDSA